MIHFITTFFAGDEWMEPLRDSISQHTQNFKIWATYTAPDEGSPEWLEWERHIIETHGEETSEKLKRRWVVDYDEPIDHSKIILKHKKDFHYLQREPHLPGLSPSQNHKHNLHVLTDMVLMDKETKDTDILIWIDSDALPIAPINEYIEDKLKSYPFAAINRKEQHRPHHSSPDAFPECIFAFTTVGFWREHDLNWDRYENDTGCFNSYTGEPGGWLLYYFTKENIDWYRLMMTDQLWEGEDENDYVSCSVYDDIIYHHCSGSLYKIRPSCDMSLREGAKRVVLDRLSTSS